ncbi:GntR family transcriptional regulator [Methylorubrum extorquens]
MLSRLDASTPDPQPHRHQGRSEVMENLSIKPIVPATSLRTLAYEALKSAITNMDIYGQTGDVRLDERGLSQTLGVSRTPIREALTVLEQEGFVRNEPRRGVFVVKKTKREIVGMIQAWAALESMAARLACTAASDDDLACLRRSFPEFFDGQPYEHLDEYSEANIRFHQKIIALGHSAVITDLTSNLLMHVRGIRNTALRQGDRASKSIEEHVQIIEALEARDADRAERLVRDHGLGLADHVQRYGDHLD